jgi:hypothetical protein
LFAITINLPLKLDFIEDIKNKNGTILFKIKAILNKINVLRRKTIK